MADIENAPAPAPGAPDPTKAKSKSVSLPPDMWERVEARASAHYNGNRSAYLRLLIERDERGETARSAQVSARVIEDLAAVYLPTRAAQLADELVRPGREDPARAISQPVIVEQFLAALLRALRAKDFDPEIPFELADKARVKRWEEESEGRLGELAELLAQRIGLSNTLPFVAEPQKPYDASHPPARKKRPPPPAPGKTG